MIIVLVVMMADSDQILYGETQLRGDDGFLDKEVMAAVEELGDLDAWDEYVYKQPYGFEVGKMLTHIRELDTDQLRRFSEMQKNYGRGHDRELWEQATQAVWSDDKLDLVLTAAVKAVQHLIPDTGGQVRLTAVFALQGAALAVISRKQLDDEQFDLLYQPWRDLVSLEKI